MTDSDVRKIMEGVADLRERMSALEAVSRMQPTRCAEHERRLDRVESTVGRQTLIATVVSAVTAGVILGLKALVGKGG